MNLQTLIHATINAKLEIYAGMELEILDKIVIMQELTMPQIMMGVVLLVLLILTIFVWAKWGSLLNV